MSLSGPLLKCLKLLYFRFLGRTGRFGGGSIYLAGDGVHTVGGTLSLAACFSTWSGTVNENVEP